MRLRSGLRAVPHALASLALVGALASLGAGDLAAQQRPAAPAPAAPAQQPPPVQLTGPSTGWVKLCQGTGPQSACVISVEMFSEQGSFLGSIGLQEVQGGRRRLITSTPLGMWIEDGVALRVGTGQPLTAPYGTCLSNGCFASFDLTDALVNQMRRGQTVSITVRPPAGAALQFDFALTGFAAAYDGPPTNPAELQQRQARFQADMRQRAEAAQRAATQAQPATPAPGAPAAPAAPRQ